MTVIPATAMAASLPRYMCINASDVAPLAGRHRYQAQADCITKYVHMLLPKGLIPPPELLRETREQAGERALAEVQARSATVQAQIAAAGQAASSLEVRDAAAAALQEIDRVAGAHDDATLALAKERCRSMVYTRFGERHESPVTRALAEEMGREIVKDDVYRKRKLFDAENQELRLAVFVGGKCDGIAYPPAAPELVEGQEGDGGALLVEVKNRINRLFRSVPEYERAQVMTYMYVTGIRQALLVEHHQGQNCRHRVPFDDSYWDGLVADLRNAVDEVVRLYVRCIRSAAGGANDVAEVSN
jgi:hypothetical protein